MAVIIGIDHSQDTAALDEPEELPMLDILERLEDKKMPCLLLYVTRIQELTSKQIKTIVNDMPPPTRDLLNTIDELIFQSFESTDSMLCDMLNRDIFSGISMHEVSHRHPVIYKVLRESIVHLVSALHADELEVVNKQINDLADNKLIH